MREGTPRHADGIRYPCRPALTPSQKRRRTVSWRIDQGFEALEPIALLSSMDCPTISGFVFLDENSGSPGLTDNGLFDPGESPIGNASVELLDANHQLVATTTTDASGAYSFGGMTPDSIANVPVTVTQTIALGDINAPNLPTNYTNKVFAPPLQLFDPSLGTLQSVQVASHVVYNSNISVTNLSQSSSATGITASISGSYVINGLGPNLTISGTPTKSGTGGTCPAPAPCPARRPATRSASRPRTSRLRS